MHKLFTESELELGRFGEFLLKRRIVPEKHAPYYVSWVRKFLSQVPDKPGVPLPDRIDGFVNNLRDQVEPWQLTQAERAVRLYFTNYLHEGGAAAPAPTLAPDAAGFIRKAEVCDGVRRLIRLRHYSIRTEHTYLHWIGRFFLYLATQENGSNGESVRISPQAVRDYLVTRSATTRRTPQAGPISDILTQVPCTIPEHRGHDSGPRRGRATRQRNGAGAHPTGRPQGHTCGRAMLRAAQKPPALLCHQQCSETGPRGLPVHQRSTPAPLPAKVTQTPESCDLRGQAFLSAA